ncbi:MAG: twin-arginine translocase subunit TatC [Candidatus Omnitrophica bacterium]|nr:twin-arginine translocase subunit TatC [Candidatus Omnitrophota bacterium]
MRRPLLEHLEELRRRLGVCLLAVVAGAVVTYGARAPLMAWLLAPVERVVFTTVAEPFMAQLRMAGWGGLLLAAPVILWQAWEFFAVGLRAQERRALAGWVPLSIALFAAGAWLGITALVPAAVRFFLGFASEQVAPMLSISQYLGFVGSLMLACGVVAQTPLVVAVLARLGIVTPAFLWYHWRGAVIGSFLVAAVVTPTPDIVTQMFLAGPLLGLYGLSIGLAAIVQPRSQRGLTHGSDPISPLVEAAHDAR